MPPSKGRCRLRVRQDTPKTLSRRLLKLPATELILANERAANPSRVWSLAKGQVRVALAGAYLRLARFEQSSYPPRDDRRGPVSKLSCVMRNGSVEAAFAVRLRGVSH